MLPKPSPIDPSTSRPVPATCDWLKVITPVDATARCAEPDATTIVPSVFGIDTVVVVAADAARRRTDPSCPTRSNTNAS